MTTHVFVKYAIPVSLICALAAVGCGKSADTDGGGTPTPPKCTEADCADANPCTLDICEPAVGCRHDGTGVTLGCDDGNACTTGDACRGDVIGTCAGTDTSAVDCDDQNGCTTDSCAPATGCAHDGTGVTTGCDDGNACTTADACQGDVAGSCAGVDTSAVDCDDGSDCTADSCDVDAGCGHALVVSLRCRPQIVVDYPPRAATIQGTTPVAVTGRVTSGNGAISVLTINGQEVGVDPETGAFSFDFAATVGANVLELAATDAAAVSASRLQAFHLSADYRLPDVAAPGSGAIDLGAAVWLAQASIDDGQAPPPVDLAAIVEYVLANLDLNSLVDSSAPLASTAGFDIYYVSDLAIGGTASSLAAIDGGLHLVASLTSLTGGLVFDCPCSGATCGCWFAGGDSTGGWRIDAIVVEADLLIGVASDHSLTITALNTTSAVSGFDAWSNNSWTNFLISIIKPFIMGGLVADLESTLESQLTVSLPGVIVGVLSELAAPRALAVTRLDGALDPGTSQPITVGVTLAGDFSLTEFGDAAPGPQGGVFGMRAWATTAAAGVPVGAPWDANLGVPLRTGCGAGPQALVVPELASAEEVYADDVLNEVLRAAWWGGWLEQPVQLADLPATELAAAGITSFVGTLSGWLPPLLSDCAAGELRFYVGDLRLDATVEIEGQTVNVVSWASFDAPATLRATVTGLEVVLGVPEHVQVGLDVAQDDQLGHEGALAESWRTVIVPALVTRAGSGQPVVVVPHFEIDVSAALGQAPGTTLMRPVPLATPPASERQAGNTVSYSELQ
ncbi:MAG: hypothetical protein HY903_23565 [Deltaproteobacteria bacterium]|nr:hypothetical protein [Deltaproteobacteria bacterium]